MKNTIIIMEGINTLENLIMKVDNKRIQQNELEQKLYYSNLQLTTISNNIDALIYIAEKK